MNIKLLFLFFGLLFTLNSMVFAQKSGLYIPRDIKQAYANDTRSYDGTPGKDYWQNRADYKMTVEFDPNSLALKGRENITYFNNSPDSLDRIVFHMFPNFFKKGNSRDFPADPADINEGMIIDKLFINGNQETNLAKSTKINYGHSDAVLRLNKAILPNEKLDIYIEWNFELNRKSHYRGGAVDSSSFFVPYFYPRIAVYDDINGWNNFKYTGDAEFYNDFGNYDVKITMPKNYLVWATGELQNADEVLAKKYLSRLMKAKESDKIIHIIDSTECRLKDITAQKENSWHFKAENVTDFAFASSDHYLWDARSMKSARDGGRFLVSAVYNKQSKDFYHVCGIAAEALQFMAEKIPAVPYPYPQMTVFKGFAEMEFPMMVNNPSYTSMHSTIRITAHEIFHTYFPFYTGLNESKYAWMDEGLTTFATWHMSEELDGPGNGYLSFFSTYQNMAGHFSDIPILIDTNFLKRPVYQITAYTKPAAFFLVLQDYLGEQRFKEALQTFVNRWKGKHPTPYDFFFTFQDVTGEDLSWLINPWFFEYGYLDLGIEINNNKIIVKKIGRYPAHFGLKIIYADGTEEVKNYNAGIWKNNQDDFEIPLKPGKKIKSAELLDKAVIDADLSNNAAGR